MKAPESVLVLRFSAVGDVVLTAPALEALRLAWPGTRILVAVKERLAHLLRHNPNVDEVVELRGGEGPFSFGRRLRQKRPGAVLDLQNKIRSKLLRWQMPGVPAVVWRKRELRDTLPVKLALRPYRASMRFSDRYHAAVEELVGRPLPHGTLRYFLGPQDPDPGMFDFAGHALLFAGVECAPCSFFGRSKCPRGHFRCMLDLTEERAWEAFAPLLRAGRRLPLSA